MKAGKILSKMKLFLGEVTCEPQSNLECDLPGICVGTFIHFESLASQSDCQVCDEEIRKMSGYVKVYSAGQKTCSKVA